MDWTILSIVIIAIYGSVLLIFGAILVELAKGLPTLLKRPRFSLAFLLLVRSQPESSGPASRAKCGSSRWRWSVRWRWSLPRSRSC